MSRAADTTTCLAMFPQRRTGVASCLEEEADARNGGGAYADAYRALIVAGQFRCAVYWGRVREQDVNQEAV